MELTIEVKKGKETRQDENLSTLFEKEFEKHDKITQSNPSNASAFYDWGNALLSFAEIRREKVLYESAIEKYSKAEQLGLDYNSAFYNYGLYNWGLALYRLAENKEEQAFQGNLNTFEEASRKTNDPDTLLIKGELYFILKRPDEEVKECFIKSKKDILEILTFLDKKNEDDIINTKILHSLLDLNNNDGVFFREAIKKLPSEQKTFLDAYKEVYIRSIFIISRLHVDDQNEETVAQYREKHISQILLFSDDNNLNKFRLNAIDFSNDLSEGKTLLDFIYGKEKRPSDEELNIEEYEAFASCFVFDYDSLNLFRLYGKEFDKEGTGLSLVFKDTFFNKEPKMALELPKMDSQNMKNDSSIRGEKSALFRCIYIDPNPKTQHSVVSVGRKDKYLFYRENKGEDYESYNIKMNEIIGRIRKEMDDLKEAAEKLNPAIVGQLLINLRYLVKHVAFKDEQECRIVKILNLSKDKELIKDDCKQMFFEYPLNVPEHLEKIYFGPKAVGIELFKGMLKYKGLGKIECNKSENPLA